MKDSCVLGYALTTFNPVSMTISDSLLAGWACLNLKGPTGSHGTNGSVIIVEGSNLFSKNQQSRSDWNNYGSVCIEDDDISISISDSTIFNDSVTGNIQSVFAL